MNNSKFSLFNSFLTLLILFSMSAGVFYLAFTTEASDSADFGSTRIVILLLLSPIIIKYLVQMLVAPFYGLVEKYRLRNNPPIGSPSVSVLVPAYNEEVGIIKTLESVLTSDYSDYEIVVINDGSSDKTHSLVTDYIQSHKKNSLAPKVVIKYLQLENGGKAIALNKGLEIASGEIIVTIDADSVMDANTLANMVKRFSDEKVAGVAGNVIVGNRRKPIEVMQQLEYMYGFFFKRADSCMNSVYIIGGAAAAYRKKILLELGGFDHSIITEDIEMSTRLLACGYKTRYAADALVYTEGPNEWQGLYNQRLRWKFGRILTFIKHKKIFFSTQKEHHPYLSFLLLPVAVYAEIMLLLEGFLLAIFYGYTIYASDYMPLAFVITFMACLISWQVLIDAKSRAHKNLLLIAPVAWIVFYVIDLVEFQALFRSLKRYFRKENLEWQKWVRVGLLQQTTVPSTTAASVNNKD